MKKSLSLLLPLSMFLAACGPDTREGRVAAMTGRVPAGMTLYTQQCASCHGADGKGTSSGVSLLAPAKNDSATKVLGVIINGRTGTSMSSYAAFTDQQLADVYAYVKATFGT